MPYQKSKETFKKILDYELHEPLSKSEQEKRLEILSRINKRVEDAKIQYSNKPDTKKTLEQEIFIPCFSDWRLFSAVISSVEHITQSFGENDYLLLSYQKNKKTTYIAREMFLGLSLEQTTDFLFTELNQSLPQTINREVESYTRDLIKKRVIPYHLNELIEALIDLTTEKRMNLNPEGKIDSYRESIYIKRLEAQISKLINHNPKNSRDFLTLLKNTAKKNRKTDNSELALILGEIGVWNAKMHELIKTLRVNLVEGDTEEICFNSLDFRIVSQYLATEGELQDEYLETERDIFLRDYNKFLTNLKEELASCKISYNKHKQEGDSRKMQKIKEDLLKLRGCFSDLLDPSTQEYVSELDNTINEMENP